MDVSSGVGPGSSCVAEAEQSALFEANRKLFELFLPAVAREVVAITEPRSQLVAVGGDDWDVTFTGIPLYDRGAKDYAAVQVEQTLEQPTSRVRFGKLSDSGYDRNSAPAIDTLQRGLTARGIAVADELVTEQAFHVVCMGVGLGFHLPELVRRTKCHHLQIVEVNMEFLYHSWHVMDWTPVFYEEDGAARIVRLYTSLDLERTPLQLRELLRSTNPTRVEGTLIYQHYANDQYAKVLTDLMREFGLSVSGLGFLDDDVRMVRNAYLNLKRNSPLIFHERKEVPGLPAIIVGSGPSLDGMLEDVRRNAPHGLVVACGTSLPVMLRNNIRPDCFVVLENIAEIYDYVLAAHEKWGLDGITLISTVTVDPRVPPLFERSVLFMRGGLASYPIFCHDPASNVADSSPTVTNTGFGVTSGLGFKEFYLFGVDLGAKAADRHHAADSPYMSDGMEFESKFDKEARGNFGGKVMSDYLLTWARDSFEQAILNRGGEVRVFNCSDGAFIRGSSPRLARTLTLPSPAAPKEVLLTSLWHRLSTYSDEDWARAWDLERLTAEVDTLRHRLLETLDHPDWDVFKTLYEFNFLLMVPPTRASQYFLRGTLFQIMIICVYYLNRIAQAEVAEAGEVVREVLRERTNTFADHVCGFLRDLDGGKIAGDWLIGQDGKPSPC